jgi:hypothetical protein
MVDFLKKIAEHLNWVAVFTSLAANCIFLVSDAVLFWRFVRRKAFFKVKPNQEGLYALSIGLGRDDPYNAVVEYMGKENKKKIIHYYKSHHGDQSEFLTTAEINSGLHDIAGIIGQLRRKHFREVLVFYAGPVSAASSVGYLFKNSPGIVKFMQKDTKANQYVVMSAPEN